MKSISFLHTIILLCIVLGGLAAFYFVRPNTSAQFIVGVATALAYVLWGFIHHALQKDLHMKVMIEYILIGAIAIVLLATVLKT